MSAFVAPLMGVFVTVFVGYVLLPAPADPHRKRDEALRRMREALESNAPAPTDDAPASPADPSDPVPGPAHVRPKEPPL